MEKKILIADDEPAVGETIAVLLSEAGFKTEVVSDGRTALERLKSGDYGVLVTDIIMPDLNGIELFRKAQDLLPGLEAVFISGSATEATRAKLDRLGVYGFLEKPFRPDALVGIVRKALKSNRAIRLGYLSTQATLILSKGKVLLADDHAATRAMMTEFLSAENYNITPVLDGAEALEKILVDDFDLIILDINMPRMNGIEAVRAIREHDPYTYIIVMSGEADSREVLEAIKEGANKFIAKPFQLNDFLSAIKAVDFNAISQKKKQQTGEMTARARRQVPFLGKLRFFLRVRKLSIGLVQLLLFLLLCLAGGALTAWLSSYQEPQASQEEMAPSSQTDKQRLLDAIIRDKMGK